MSLVDHTGGTSLANSGQGDGSSSTPAAGTPASSSASSPESTSQTTSPRKRRTAAEVAQEATERFNRQQEQLRQTHEKKMARIQRESIPLSDRKKNALALFDVCRDAIIASDPGRAMLADPAFEALITEAILAAYPAPLPQPGDASPGNDAPSDSAPGGASDPQQASASSSDSRVPGADAGADRSGEPASSQLAAAV